MKKLLTVLLVLTITAALFFGCAPKDGKSSSEPPPNSGEQSSSEDDSGSGDGITGGTSYTGKVTGIVGNEIEVDLANFPGMTFDGSEGEGGMIAVSPSFSVEADGDGGGSVIANEDISGEDAGDGQPNISFFADDGSGNVISLNPSNPSGEDGGLEFTGEQKSFTVPAGAKITNLSGEGKLENIKKGSVVTFIVDENNIVTEVIIMS